ncbi:MAG: phage tail fiber protein [Planctomycetota bacterium]
MANARTLYTANGETTLFTVSFPYINREHVLVELNGSLQLDPSNYRWADDQHIEFLAAPTNGSAVEVIRKTPNEPLVDFENGAVITEAELDLAHRQKQYRTEEVEDSFRHLLEAGALRIAGEEGVIATDTESFVDAMIAEVLQSDLVNELLGNVAGSELNAESILNLQAIIDNERLSRLGADATINELLAGAGASVGGRVFIQASEPVPGVDGIPDPIPNRAIWYNSAQNNEPSFWNSDAGAWISLADARVADHEALLDAILSHLVDTSIDLAVSSSAQRILNTTVTDHGETLTAQSSAITQLQTQLGDPDGDYAEASAVDALETRVTTAEGGIATNASNIVALDAAIAAASGSTDPASAAAIAALDTRVTQTEADITAQASSITGLTTDVADNEAAILAEQTARSDAVSAEASARATLQSQVDTNEAVLTTVQSSVGGISAKYAVKVDVNGHVAGFGLLSEDNDGSVVSEFIVAANKFGIVDPGNGLSDPIVPFSVSEGVVTMGNVVIDTANIGTLSVDKLVDGSLSANVDVDGDLNVAAGRIIFDNGTHMKVQGVGFGVDSDLIEWFGVRPAGGDVSLCSRANATMYLATDGSAYFGGSLSAGALTHANSTQSLLPDAEIIVGPFGTNGGNKQLVLSYSYANQVILSTTNPPGDHGDTIDATIEVHRRVNGGGWVFLDSFTFSGPNQEDQELNELGTFWNANESMAGSHTFTDAGAGSGNIEYRARLTARGNLHSGFTYMTQTISIRSTED